MTAKQTTEQATTKTEDFLASFDDEAMFVEIIDEGFVGNLVDQVSDALIDVLRNDPRWAGLRYAELDLLLADLRKRLHHDLLERIDGYVSFSEIRKAARRAASEAFAEED
jgi:hypothetical protein